MKNKLTRILDILAIIFWIYVGIYSINLDIIDKIMYFIAWLMGMLGLINSILHTIIIKNYEEKTNK